MVLSQRRRGCLLAVSTHKHVQSLLHKLANQIFVGSANVLDLLRVADSILNAQLEPTFTVRF